MAVSFVPFPVSILIPCHNAGPWLAETLDSAFAQTWPDIEVIFVNDGSTDDSMQIARRYESRGLTILSQSNHGASAARNAGLAVAHGDFIQFLDADDLLAPNKIERQLQRLLGASTDCIASGPWARFANRPAEACFAPEPVWRDLSGLEFQLMHYEAGWMMQPAAWLCPRALLDSAGPWDETLSLNDDGEYFSRVMLRSAGILFCADACTYYRSRLSGSLSRRSDPSALRSLWKSTELNCARLLESAGRTNRAQAAAANGWKRLAFELYPALPDLAARAEANCHALGGSSVPFPAGKNFHRLAGIVGWRTAKRLRDFTLSWRT